MASFDQAGCIHLTLVVVSSQLQIDPSPRACSTSLSSSISRTRRLPQTLHALKGGEKVVVLPSDLDLLHRLHAILSHGEMRESGVSCVPRGVVISDGTRVLEGCSGKNPHVPDTCSPWFYHAPAELHIHEDTPLLDILTSIAAARQLAMPCMVLASRSLVCSGPLLELYFTACECTPGGLPTKSLTRTMLVVGAGRAPRPKDREAHSFITDHCV